MEVEVERLTAAGATRRCPRSLRTPDGYVEPWMWTVMQDPGGQRVLRGRASEQASMIPQTRYAKTPDGVYIAYQTLGEGPIDIVWQFEWIGNVDTIWEYRPLRRMVPRTRVVLAADPARPPRDRRFQPERRPSQPRDTRRRSGGRP